MVKLLDVKDRFLISGRGVVLYPDFPLPPEGRFRSFAESVLLVKPDGSRAELEASFQTAHFRLSGGGSLWAVTVMLKAEKADVPAGSEVYCRGETRALLVGQAA